MATSCTRAGARWVPFYKYAKPKAAGELKIVSHWAPVKTGRLYEDWAIGKAYADTVVEGLRDGSITTGELVLIVMDMRKQEHSHVATGFLDTIGRRLAS